MKGNLKTNACKLTAAMAIMSMLTGCASASASNVDASKLLTTTVLKIGKADAIVVEQGENTMVIDCGEEEDGLEVLEYLASRKTDKIDVLIITHYDKDHVGGADTVLEGIEVGRILLPDYDGTSTDYQDFLDAAGEIGILPERLTESVSFPFGDALVTVDPPLDYSSAAADRDPNLEIDNNLSLITTIVHGNNRLIYMGDAEKARIKEFLTTDAAVDCDFLKVPHHGVYTSALNDLLDAVTPEYAAINDSAKNPADDETLQTLKDYGVSVRQTMSGKIVVISDGERIEMKQTAK